MRSFSGIVVNGLLLALCAAPSPAQTTVRRVKVLDSKEAVEIEVEASGRIVPETRVLTGPDRLVVDFPNAIPGLQLHNQPVNRGEVKDVRVGLFQAKPPITRVVLDLKSAQSYQIFPYGRTVIVKITGNGGDTMGLNGFPPQPPARAGPVPASPISGTQPAHDDPPAKPTLEVSFQNGLLAIKADKATLSDVLVAVQQRTGAQISLAAGAEQEKVVTNLGPAPAPEVLAQLLNGSKFNFLILSAVNDPHQLDRVILSARGPREAPPLAPLTENDLGDSPVPPASAQAPPGNTPPPNAEIPPQSKPEIPPTADEGPRNE